MNRRKFIKSTLAGSVTLVSGIAREIAAAETAQPKLDKTSVSRILAEHKVAKFEVRQVQDRFPRAIGPNSKGNPVGGGGGYQVCTMATNQGASGWAMCS